MTVEPKRNSVALEQALRRINRRLDAQQLFLQYPRLQVAAERLCAFLSSLLEVDEKPLVDIALARAFERAMAVQGPLQLREFAYGIVSVADILCTMQVSVQDCDGDWPIWDFERPIVEWMQSHKQQSIQVRKREKPLSAGPVRLAILSRVFAMRDLITADIEVVV